MAVSLDIASLIFNRAIQIVPGQPRRTLQAKSMRKAWLIEDNKIVARGRLFYEAAQQGAIKVRTLFFKAPFSKKIKIGSEQITT